MSIDQVTVDLLRASPNSPAETWPVEKTATPDPSGAFAFDELAEGDYSLRVNQPEFAELAYRVDSTDFHLGAGQTVNLVLPLVTTVSHNLMDPKVAWNPNVDSPPAAALDPATGEVVLTSNLGFAVVDPDRGKMDLLFSNNYFIGRQGMPGQMERRVVALAPTSRIAWLLYRDRLVRIDRSLFTNPAESEVLNLDDPATRAAIGDKFRFRMLPSLHNDTPGGPVQERVWTGEVYFSPDERTLYASTQDSGVMVFDLEHMEIVRVILGQVIGYNPVSNLLIFTNGKFGQHDGTEILVVNASTLMEVNSASLANVLGVAPVPSKPETILVRSQRSTSEAVIPFVVVVDGTGTITTDQRARDYLGLDHDPPAGAPSFDLTGRYFMIGSAAFRVLDGGGFEAVPVAVPSGRSFTESMQCNNLRAVDPANLYEIWYGCLQSNTVGLISLDQTNVPVAVRPSVPVSAVLLDRTRGRAIFGGFDRLVLIHYADPSAAGRDELDDLSSVVAPFVQPGVACSAANPCSGADLCAGATDTSFTGRCTPNPRLPYLPFCGGFTHALCDEDFTCKLANPTNPNSVGECLGTPSRDYSAHGPSCSAALPCPVGMRCGATTNRCEPKICLHDQDCAAYPSETCGLVENLGRVCLLPGTLSDGAACLGPEECLHGACVAIAGASQMGDSDLLHGARGLLACTTPCYQNAECPGGAQCVYDGPPSLPNQPIDGESLVWMHHRVQVMPYCRPPVLTKLEGCEGVCTSEQLCQSRTPASCETGFEPLVPVKQGTSTSYDCLPPAEACEQVECNVRCEYRCRRSGDCPFKADCVGGFCSADGMRGSPCNVTCAADQSCAYTDYDHGTCTAADACATDAACGGVAGSCLHGACLGPPRACTAASDCGAGEECVEQLAMRQCLPAQCGCAGAHAAEMVCISGTRTCAILGDCTDVPCDGSVLAQCNSTPPVPLPPMCTCPNCAWNDDLCPGSGSVPMCPSGFTCTMLGQPQMIPHLGRGCACDSPGCQTP